MDKIEPHLVKHYRLRFEQGYGKRYESSPRVELDILPLLLPFVEALGFYHTGPRKLQMDTQEELLDSLFGFFVKHNNTIITDDVVLAKYLGIAAFLHDYGGDYWTEYSKLESLFRMCYTINHNRVRIIGKEVYSCIAMRFDQYMTCSPITPIRWSSIEKPAKSTTSPQAQPLVDDLNLRWQQWKAKYSK